MNLIELRDEVRAAMVSEVERDTAADRWHKSPRLTEAGVVAFPALLLDAVRAGSPASLVRELNAGGRLKHTEDRKTSKSGKAEVPYPAAETLGEGEFNRYYCRAVCRLAVERGGPDAVAEAYRAKAVANPRSASASVVGERVSAAAVLEELREVTNSDTRTKHGIPGGPNSGVSVRFVMPSVVESQPVA